MTEYFANIMILMNVLFIFLSSQVRAPTGPNATLSRGATLRAQERMRVQGVTKGPMDVQVIHCFVEDGLRLRAVGQPLLTHVVPGETVATFAGKFFWEKVII